MSQEIALDDYFNEGHQGGGGGKKKPKPNKEKKRISFFKRKGVKAPKEKRKSPFHFNDDCPKSYRAMTVGRYVFWIIAVCLLLKGIAATVAPVRPIIRQERYIPAYSESETVKAFALQFVREYLTYDASVQDGYAERLGRYVGFNIAQSYRMGWSEVLETNVWQVKKLDDKNAVVTVHARVRQGSKAFELGDDPTVPQPSAGQGIVKEVYVKVPVRVVVGGKAVDERYVVSDYPVFTAPFESVDYYDGEPFTGLQAVTDSTEKEVKVALDNFFKIYDDGTEEQISYYMLDSRKMKGYEGCYAYESIRNLQVYQLEKGNNRVLITAEITVKDEFGTVFNQRFNFILVKQKTDGEMRWYIERFVDVGEVIK